jgi:hypothetical protein
MGNPGETIIFEGKKKSSHICGMGSVEEGYARKVRKIVISKM